MSAPRPPRLWATLVRWFVRGAGSEFVLGDLAEEYAETHAREGRAAADSLESLLFGVRASDPATLGAVSAAVMLVTTLALWIPAYQAARTDPAEATRAD